MKKWIIFLIFFQNYIVCLSQLNRKQCTDIQKKVAYINNIKSLKDSIGRDSAYVEKYNFRLKRLKDSMDYLSYVERGYYKIGKTGVHAGLVVTDSNGWIIPDSVAQQTRFGHLRSGQSVDLYYMKPVIFFYDSAWDQHMANTYKATDKDGIVNIGPCRCNPWECPFGSKSEQCQYELFVHRLAITYDILPEDAKRLGKKGKDMRYLMFRRITITKQDCYYSVQYYKDIFASDSDVQMLHWYIDKYKNRIAKDTFIPRWEIGYLQNTTLTFHPNSHPDLLTKWLDYYSHRLCEMERKEYGASGLYLSKKFINNPSESSLWNDGVFMDTWQIMDFGDDNPVSRRFTTLGDYLMYRHPLNADYYSMRYDYHYYKHDIRPYFKSYNKRRRFLYYKILRYPSFSIQIRIDDYFER